MSVKAIGFWVMDSLPFHWYYAGELFPLELNPLRTKDRW